MGQIRITGGTHRSRKIQVDDQPGLRPTTDRIREVLFNWLGHNLSGWRVLDLYAGSGILAFEAASRSASVVTCVDNNRNTINQLRHHIKQLQLPQIEAVQSQAEAFIKGCKQTFDLIFLDPPFDGDEMVKISGIISALLPAEGLLYREFASSQIIPPMDASMWTLIKHKKAGQVCIELWQKNND